jgi:hypothetical protein
MTLDELIEQAESLRAAHGGQARVVLPGQPMPVARTLEALTAAKIRPAAYANAEGLGMRWTETVVVLKP